MKITIDESNTITVELDNGHVQAFPPQQQEDCVKAAVQQEKAEGWEKRCEELEEENRNLMSEHFEMLQTIEELERRLRDAQDRIHEQDVTIALYDDDNRRLKRRIDNQATCISALSKTPMSLNDWAARIHRNAVEHGWWESWPGKCDDGERNFAEVCMMCVTELAEAVNEFRNDKAMFYKEGNRPEGVAVEMVDCMIRILDWLGHEGVDVDGTLEEKYNFNLTREHRHGGKKL